MNDNLLQNAAELNLGQSAQLNPGQNVGQPGAEEKLALHNSPDSKLSQVVTFHFSSFTPNLQGNPGGPVVGIVEFSAGGAKLNRIEFDVPSPRPFLPNHAAGFPRRELNNGVSLSVVGSGFQALARNDGRVSPVNDPSVAIAGGNNITVSVHLGRLPLGRDQNSLKRTVYCVAPGGAPLVPGANLNFGIPNFARAVLFPRVPMTEPIEVLVTGIGFAAGPWTVPAGASAPAPDAFPLVLPPGAFTMTITNTGANDITSLVALFDLEV